MTNFEKLSETGPARARTRTYPVGAFWDAEAFLKVVEHYQQPLYRYYAVHTGGDMRRAQEMTLETFSIVYDRPVSFGRQSLASSIFGAGWDVLNAHYSRREAESNDQGAETVEVNGFRNNCTQVSRVLKALRALTFYPRETLYLRFFAELDSKDIMVLMDKSEITVKLLVYQGVLRFASRMYEVDSAALSRDQLLSLSQAYHVYLNSTLAGTPSQQDIRMDAVHATDQLMVLRGAISLMPETSTYLTTRVEQVIRSRNTNSTRL